MGEAAQATGTSENNLRRWKKHLEQEQSGTRLQLSERSELDRLRRENKRLKMEQEILKKTSAFFAKEMPSSGLLHHSDRGSQYASNEYQQLLRQNGIISSMSRKGNCWDNVPVERFLAVSSVNGLLAIVIQTEIAWKLMS